MELNLKSDGTPYQDNILKYLTENVSETLAEKINTGKKTLDGCLNFIREQAHKQAKNGCAYIEDKEVYGWAVHYFEEDDIKEAEKKVEKTTKTEKKVEKVEKVEKPTKTKPKENDGMLKNQMTIFDFGFTG